jgi:hypothetical protein
MSTKRNLLAVSLAAVLLLSVAGPAIAGTSETDGLSVGVEQEDGVTVSVVENGTAAENASVTVTALDNGSYAGEGTYTTDANGTVGLPAPSQNVSVEVVAEHGNLSATTTANLTVSDSGGEAEDDEAEGPFGQEVSNFVSDVLEDDSVDNPGQAISEWVTENNPGHADDDDEKDEQDDEEDDDKRGPPEHANDDKKDDDGKEEQEEKEHEDDEKDEQDDEKEEQDDEEDDEDDHPGNGNGKKKGHGN